MKFTTTAAAAILLLSLFASAQQMPPNQDCGTTSVHYTWAEITGVGESIDYLDSKDRVHAGILARMEIWDALGALSGVACDICPDGIQCSRKVHLLDNTQSEYEEIPGDNWQESGWECTSTFSGGYEVECRECANTF